MENSKNTVRKAIVSCLETIPGYIRVHFQTPDTDSSSWVPGSYIKVLFPNNDTVQKRSYTLAGNSEEGLYIDMVKHGKNGLASQWQSQIAKNSIFSFMGPGPSSKLDLHSNVFYIHCDPSSLPAAAAHIKNISGASSIHMYFEGPSEVVKSYLKDVQTEFYANTSQWLESLNKSMPEKTAIWIAGERNQSVELKKQLFENASQYRSFYCSSYWQEGVKDETHRELKKAEKIKND